MNISNIQAKRFLYAAEGVGIAFVAIYLAAYLGGLLVPNPGGQPGTIVLHSEMQFRIPLAVLGAAFLILIAIGFIVAAKPRK